MNTEEFTREVRKLQPGQCMSWNGAICGAGKQAHDLLEIRHQYQPCPERLITPEDKIRLRTEINEVLGK